MADSDTGVAQQDGLAIDNFRISAVPEPTTMIVGLLLLPPFASVALRVLRKTRAT